MNARVVLAALILLSFAPEARAEAPVVRPELGHLFVRCPADVRVFVDGIFRGVTTEEYGGLIVRDLTPGYHLLSVAKKGFRTHEDFVLVGPHTVIEQQLQPFDPEEPGGPRALADVSAPRPQSKVGGLVVQSIPRDILIDSPALSLTHVAKTTDEWSAELVQGVYEIQFSAAGKKLRQAVRIEHDRDLFLMVDFDEGRVFEVRAFPERRLEPPTREALQEGPSTCRVLHGLSPGYITLDSKPWAEVLFQGMKLGETPLANATLPAGCVELQLRDPTSQKERTVRVWVEPNASRIYRFDP
jgi:hypothetical protein